MKSSRELTKREQKLYEHLLGLFNYLYNNIEREKLINTLDELITSLLYRCCK